jgi:hypothetical protein
MCRKPNRTIYDYLDGLRAAIEYQGVSMSLWHLERYLAGYSCALEVNQIVRREKSGIFSGCNSHPATGSLQPVAIEATVEVTKPFGAFETSVPHGGAAS